MRIQPGSSEYEEHKKAEIEHYAKVFDGFSETKERPLFQPVPASWVEVETRAANLIRQATGQDLTGHLIERARRPGSRMLSLGSGPGGIELLVASVVPEADILCTDFNPTLLALGRERASMQALKRVRFEQADLNTLNLPASTYDVVFCHASLHHVVELEHVAEQIRKTLRANGELIVLDVVTPSGYRMWPESGEVVRAIWPTLPEELRVNHTAYADGPRVDADVWEADTSESGMECIRSGEIIEIIDRTFRRDRFVPYFSISRRFFDTMYGPNYDLQNSLHKAILNWIWELDCYYIKTGKLKPETFFGIYKV